MRSRSCSSNTTSLKVGALLRRSCSKCWDVAGSHFILSKSMLRLEYTTLLLPTKSTCPSDLNTMVFLRWNLTLLMYICSVLRRTSCIVSCWVYPSRSLSSYYSLVRKGSFNSLILYWRDSMLFSAEPTFLNCFYFFF